MHSDSVISRLIRLIHFAQEAENDYLGILSVGERAAQGTYQEWAPKDMVAHTNYWRKRAIEMLAYLSREQQPPEYPSDEQVNRENFEENHDVPLEQLMRESRSILKAMEEALRRFEDEDLTDPGRYPWRKGQPALITIVNDAYLHPIAHLCQFCLKTGDQATAFQLQEAVVKDVCEVVDNPVSRNLVIYNLACFLAQIGKIDQAIEKLAEVFPDSPDLAEWSRQDLDLACLQNDPRYLALINR